MKLSKNVEVFKVNDREYRTKRWSTITTMLEGKKLLLALAPSFTTIADMKMASSNEPTLDEIVEGSDIEFLLTGAISQLSANFSDEHFESLCNKLLSNFEFRERREEDGEYGDFIKIEDWSEHFDDHGEDFELVVVKSARLNLYDFFMKQATVRSSIEKVLTVVKPLTTQIEKNLSEGLN